MTPPAQVPRFVKLNDRMCDHPKIGPLSDKGFRAFVCALSAMSSGQRPSPRGRGMTEVIRADLFVVAPNGELALGEVEDIVLGFGQESERRRSIPRSVRLAVYERDEWTCLHCGATDRLSLDHIYPWSLGGSDDIENLQTLCISCNSSKGALV